MEPTITLTMDFKRACALMRVAELAARIGMGQFKEIVEFMCPFTDWDTSKEIEIYLKGKLRPELNFNSYDGVSSKKVPEDAQVAWDAYQHIRREISWAMMNKDWRTDERDWKEMVAVSYDNPMKVSSLPGDFKTSVVKE
jgi:hypothetical protein